MKIKNYTIENIKIEDYPKFCDAYLSYAEDVNGKPLSDNELETWEKQNYNKFYQMILETLI
jgi:hypothetical protein